MARMPGAAWQGEHGASLMSAHDVFCVHTIVGNPPAHAAHFSTRADGWLYQSRDTRYRSAANLDGNYRVIAVENDDHGPEYGSWSGSNVPRFTDAQSATLVQLILWVHATHGIPIELVPDSKPGRRGIAYHRQGCDGNFGGYAYPGRVPGGELWSSAFGKVCPGDRRISQLINEIIPRARQLAGLEEDFDMASAEEIARVLDGYYVRRKELYGDQDSHDLGRGVSDIEEVLGDVYRATRKSAGQVIVETAKTVAELKAAQSAPVPVEIDYDRLINGVVAKLGALKFDVE